MVDRFELVRFQMKTTQFICHLKNSNLSTMGWSFFLDLRFSPLPRGPKFRQNPGYGQ